ncbi:MAG: hypothetical protein ACREKE_05955, partial [bacterium]
MKEDFTRVPHGAGRLTGKGLLALGVALFFALAGCATARNFQLPTAPPPAPAAYPAPNGLPLRVLLRIGHQGLRASAPGGLRLLSPAEAVLVAIPPTAH